MARLSLYKFQCSPWPLFIRSKFSISGSLLTSSNRPVKRTAQGGEPSKFIRLCVLASLELSASQLALFLGVLHQSASQSLLSKREIRLPRIFEWLLFVSPFYLSTLQTVSPHHFISQALLIRLRQNADSPYESGDPIMHTTL